ncbi:MAG: hypothetical protein M0R32_05835 [Candidatus Cloacimonetes bacterium]|jgi:hypothetical protein|nr:hypothetical protein [Candidatus Cloacimonadota bacterium]
MKAKLDPIVAAQKAYILERLGKKAIITEDGRYECPERRESKVVDKDGYHWIVTTEKQGPNYHSRLYAAAGFDDVSFNIVGFEKDNNQQR